MFTEGFISAGDQEAGLFQCGSWLATHLVQGKQLLLDGDGVIVKGDSLHRTRLFDQGLIAELIGLENKGIAVGMATERGEQIVRWLRDQGLKMEGTSILEGGQLVKNDTGLEYLVSKQHLRLVASLRKTLRQFQGYRQSWQEVAKDNSMTFCPGNFQWQGRARASFWFKQTGDYEQDSQKVAELFLPSLEGAASSLGLSLDKDISLRIVRMKVNQLGILVIKSNGFDKSAAAGKLKSGAILVEDGFGAINLGRAIRQKGGAVIGIRGNLDISTESSEFLREVADVVLDTPTELVTVLSATNNFLIKA